MKPEPLKDSICWLHHIYNDEAYRIRKKKGQSLACIKGFSEPAVKSAVEWLKEEIMPNQKIKEFSQWQIIDLINEAFEDVVKNQKARRRR